MTPIITPPEPGDVDVWGQVLRSGSRITLSTLAWVETYGMPMAMATIAAWLMGMEHGYQGAKLKLFIGTGFLFAYVGTPVVLEYFKLTPDLWSGVVACFLSVKCWQIAKWAEDVAMKKLQINRRRDGNS